MSDKTEEACRALLKELHLVLTDRTREAVGTRMTLRDAVCDYVVVEQARGVAIARIIQTVKDILRNAEQEASSESPSVEIRDNDLANQLVDWCVEFNHAATARSH
ncbi:MAG: hypothetical protein M3Z17_04035 [Gemmatimonadota bacterium]|nr:hypothetical protein [Gemmatimonadota bacterium]